MKHRIVGSMFTLLAFAAVLQAPPSPPPTEAAFPGANGKILFTRLEPGPPGIYLMDADGANQSRISTSLAVDQHPAWSPDGSQIAFSRNGDIWTMDADGTDQSNVTDTPFVHETEPSWAPDGERLVFLGDATLKIINLTDSTILDLGMYGVSPAWSPDGGRIAFTDPSVPTLRMMNSDGSNVVAIAEPFATACCPDWSPDGTQLAIAGIGGLAGPVKLVDECGGNAYTLPLPAGSQAIDPAWSPDGSKLVTWVDNAIMIMNADGSGQQVIASDAYFGGVDWQPIVDIPSTPQPRSHTCVGLDVSTPTPPATPEGTPRPIVIDDPIPVPVPTPTPIELPNSGGAPKQGFPAPIAAASTFVALTVTSLLVAYRLSRPRS
jgi:dipeptidyl aminopeptidase/acylaminoacyl peptidase